MGFNFNKPHKLIVSADFAYFVQDGVHYDYGTKRVIGTEDVPATKPESVQVVQVKAIEPEKSEALKETAVIGEKKLKKPKKVEDE